MITKSDELFYKGIERIVGPKTYENLFHLKENTITILTCKHADMVAIFGIQSVITINITKTRLYNFDLLKPHFYI